MLVLIDNYDSFTYNLVHFLGELGARAEVIRNDKATPEEIIARAPSGIVISPGPCDPDQAGICLDLITRVNGDDSDTGRVSGASMYWSGLWRQNRARQSGDAWQAERDFASKYRSLQRLAAEL